MTYDQWKCSDPNEPYDDEPECDHEDYETDILDARCRCVCGHSWHAEIEDINAEIERQARYQEDMDRENRRQWWRDRTYPVRMFIHRVLARVWPRRSLSVLHDDEIPF